MAAAETWTLGEDRLGDAELGGRKRPMDNVKLFQNILARAKKELNPKLRVGPKSQFGIHNLINAILNIVYPKTKKDAYLKNYNTTLGYTIAMAEYVGDDASKFGNWRTLAHEIQHAEDARKWTRVLFGFLYLWPISQGVVFLLFGWIGAIWCPGYWKLLYLMLWFVATGLHFIPQWPDPWRKHWEFKAYSISMYLRHLVNGDIPDWYIENLAKNFSSMMYYMMDPDHAGIKLELRKLASRIREGKAVEVEHLAIVQIVRSEYDKLKRAA